MYLLLFSLDIYFGYEKLSDGGVLFIWWSGLDGVFFLFSESKFIVGNMIGSLVCFMVMKDGGMKGKLFENFFIELFDGLMGV